MNEVEKNLSGERALDFIKLSFELKSSKLYKELYEDGILFVTPSLDYEFARGYAHILITGQSPEPEKKAFVFCGLHALILEMEGAR